MLLAIDTSTRFAGVALAEEDRVVAARTWFSRVNHSAELMPAVVQILKEQGITPKDLRGIAVSLGPGGFSALRVGLSVAKGLAAAEGLPLAGVGTLEMEAQPYRGAGLPVCAMVDAGRSDVAYALFGADGTPAGEEEICPPEELLDSLLLNPASLDSVPGPTLFCGEGTAPWTSLIKERLGGAALVVETPTPAARLWSLGLLGLKRMESGETDEPATLQPNYLRMPSIGGARRRDHRVQGSRPGGASEAL